MKRNLIAVVAAALALGTTAAVADNNYVFDDAYWKRSESTSVQAALPMEATESRGKYNEVDGFNP